MFVFSRTIGDIIDGDVDTDSGGGEIDGDDRAHLHHGVEPKVGDSENGGGGDGHGVDDSDGLIALVVVVAMVITGRTFIIEVSTGAWARFCNVLVRVTEA